MSERIVCFFIILLSLSWKMCELNNVDDLTGSQAQSTVGKEALICSSETNMITFQEPIRMKFDVKPL